MRVWMVLSFLLAITIIPSFAADAENGQRLAKLWCAACHFVEDDKSAVISDAPNFSVLARKKLSESDLAQSLMSPHPRMPERGLSRDEAADIAAYIRSFNFR